jgi:DNA-binding beta-propeller fold protein YncE
MNCPIYFRSSAFVATILCVAHFSLHQISLGQEKLSERIPVQLPGLQRNGETLLPNGWSLRPVGEQIDMGDFPSRMEISPDGKYAAVQHTGWGTHEIRIVSITDRKTISTVVVDQTFQGLRFSENGKKLYVSGAEDACVYVYDHRDGYLALNRKSQLVDPKEKLVIAGITETHSGKTLLACGMLADQLLVTDLTRIPAASDSSTALAAVTRISLPQGSFPIDVVVSPDQKLAMVSLWGHASVAVCDLTTNKMVGQWATRSHPTEMLFLDEGKYLLVGCTDDNSVVVLNTRDGTAIETIQTSLYATTKNGSTPNSLSVSPDQKALIVANADNNNLALFDISERGKSSPLGFIPVGWYPTSVRFTKEGDQILVTNGKGLASRDNAKGPNPLQEAPKSIREYIGGLFKGTLSVIPVPSPNQIVRWTKDAYAVSPLRTDGQPNLQSLATESVIPARVGDPSQIKHCFYIIKENRTYDQVFGDIQKGNGDPSLCIFPESVTPNHHALVNEFVLLDNFYVESEVSADGHEWSMAAYATDFVERVWPLNYRGGKGKLGYTSEGGYEIAAPSSGYIWDQCRKAGVTYFSFGEFIQNGKSPDMPGKARVEALQDHFDPLYRSYDLDYLDVDRAKRFEERFAEFERKDDLPQLIILRISNDHTSGTRVGKRTPTAMVADNDLALGRIVETISKSRYWPNSAIFVVEDDAQNGSDHVDAHRTVALAISPFIRRGTVDSTLYTTSSMLRSMELMLGLEPMTQFDAAANPMYSSFGKTADLKAYTARPAQVDLNATNTALAWGAIESEKLDLTREDAADDLLLGEIVWRSVRGADSKMPPPVRSAFVFSKAEDEDEDEDEDQKNREKQIPKK